MTNLLARILLAVMLLPLAATVYLVVVFSLMGMINGATGMGSRRSAEALAFLLATLITVVFVAVYWLRLWRDSVRWTGDRTRRTIVSSLACIGLGIVGAAVLTTMSRINEVSFAFFIGGLLAIVSWLPITVVLWKETPGERADRLRHAAADVLCCPRCGYNMTGLHEARCPECGAQFTLNQLYAAQQKHEIADAAVSREEQPQELR